MAKQKQWNGSDTVDSRSMERQLLSSSAALQHSNTALQHSRAYTALQHSGYDRPLVEEGATVELQGQKYTGRPTQEDTHAARGDETYNNGHSNISKPLRDSLHHSQIFTTHKLLLTFVFSNDFTCCYDMLKNVLPVY